MKVGVVGESLRSIIHMRELRKLHHDVFFIPSNLDLLGLRERPPINPVRMVVDRERYLYAHYFKEWNPQLEVEFYRHLKAVSWTHHLNRQRITLGSPLVSHNLAQLWLMWGQELLSFHPDSSLASKKPTPLPFLRPPSEIFVDLFQHEYIYREEWQTFLKAWSPLWEKTFHELSSAKAFKYPWDHQGLEKWIFHYVPSFYETLNLLKSYWEKNLYTSGTLLQYDGQHQQALFSHWLSSLHSEWIGLHTDEMPIDQFFLLLLDHLSPLFLFEEQSFCQKAQPYLQKEGVSLIDRSLLSYQWNDQHQTIHIHFEDMDHLLEVDKITFMLPENHQKREVMLGQMSLEKGSEDFYFPTKSNQGFLRCKMQTQWSGLLDYPLPLFEERVQELHSYFHQMEQFAALRGVTFFFETPHRLLWTCWVSQQMGQKWEQWSSLVRCFIDEQLKQLVGHYDPIIVLSFQKTQHWYVSPYRWDMEPSWNRNRPILWKEHHYFQQKKNEYKERRKKHQKGLFSYEDFLPALGPLGKMQQLSYDMSSLP
jgi:hypothetical protein